MAQIWILEHVDRMILRMDLLLIKNLRDLQRRPLRTVLTVIGVLLGVAGVVAISFTGRNLAVAQRQTYASTKQPDITAFVSNLSPTLVGLIERRDNVAVADTRSVQFTRMSVGNGWVSTRLVGVPSFTNANLSTLELVSGRYPERGEVVFDITATKLANLHIGDLVALQPDAGAATSYATISGFVRAPATIDASILNQASAFVPDHDLLKILGHQYDNYLMLRVDQPQRASQTANDIAGFLDKRGISHGEFTVRDPNSFTGSRELETLLLLLRVFSYVGAALSSFLVANTIAAVMIEESRQIGIIKALGGTRWTAMRTYLTFAAMVGLAGGALGWLIGLIGGRALSVFLAGLSGLVLPPFTLSTRELALALSVGLLVTLSSAAIPAWFAARKRVAPLIASVGVTSDFHRGIVQRVTRPLGRVTAMTAIGLRNLVRRPVRAWITLGLVAIAVATFLATQAVSASVNTTVDHLYALYGADGWIYFNQYMDIDFGQVLQQQPDVVQAEPWGNTGGSLGSVRTDVWGLPADTQIYTPRVTSGTWLRDSSPMGAVLTSNLAATLHARVGDVRTLDIGQTSTLIQVVGIVNDSSTYLGATTTGKLFLRVEDLQSIAHVQNLASLFALKLRSSNPNDVDRELQQLEDQFRQYGPQTLATYQDQASSRQAIDILTLMLNAMVVIIGIVGLAGITNTLIINLTERRREFGVLRALGATAFHLIRLVMSEALGIAAAGCVLGIAVGYPLARYLVYLTGTQLFQLDFSLNPSTIVLTLVVALAATAAISTGPGLIAARIRPIVVLRYE
jgi:putative ABC transport system permease protein